MFKNRMRGEAVLDRAMPKLDFSTDGTVRFNIAACRSSLRFKAIKHT